MQEASTETLNDAKLIGQTIAGRFELVSILGRGGTSTVYLGVDLASKAEFAIKILRPEFNQDYIVVKRFQREAQAAKRFSHPNIVSVHADGKTKDGLHYIVIDIICGITLAEILEDEVHLTVARSIPIFTQITSALAHAHASGIVHRDLKPANIMISQTPQEDMVRLVDFGIAKVTAEKGKRLQKLTSPGEIFGTCLYLSPEQCVGKPADSRSDIYSLGCLMYEVLSGLPPFVGFSPFETIEMHLNENVVPLTDLHEELIIPDELSEIVLRCLRRNPRDRYQSMADVEKELNEFETALGL